MDSSYLKREQKNNFGYGRTRTSDVLTAKINSLDMLASEGTGEVSRHPLLRNNAAANARSRMSPTKYKHPRIARQFERATFSRKTRIKPDLLNPDSNSFDARSGTPVVAAGSASFIVQTDPGEDNPYYSPFGLINQTTDNESSVESSIERDGARFVRRPSRQTTVGKNRRIDVDFRYPNSHSSGRKLPLCRISSCRVASRETEYYGTPVNKRPGGRLRQIDNMKNLNSKIQRYLLKEEGKDRASIHSASMGRPHHEGRSVGRARFHTLGKGKSSDDVYSDERSDSVQSLSISTNLSYGQSVSPKKFQLQETGSENQINTSSNSRFLFSAANDSSMSMSTSPPTRKIPHLKDALYDSKSYEDVSRLSPKSLRPLVHRNSKFSNRKLPKNLMRLRVCDSSPRDPSQKYRNHPSRSGIQSCKNAGRGSAGGVFPAQSGFYSDTEDSSPTKEVLSMSPISFLDFNRSVADQGYTRKESGGSLEESTETFSKMFEELDMRADLNSRENPILTTESIRTDMTFNLESRTRGRKDSDKGAQATVTKSYTRGENKV